MKNLDLDIPLNQVVVISGVSGSGKSSLAFDTIYAEGQRRYIEGFSLTSRRQLERIERPDADRIAHLPVTLAIRTERATNRSISRSTVGVIAEVLDGLAMLWTRIGRVVCPGCQAEIQTHSSADLADAMDVLPEGTRCQLVFEITDRAEPAANWLARGFARAIWDKATHPLNAQTAWPKTGDLWLVVDRLIAGKTARERLIESAETAFREGHRRCGLLIEQRSDAPDQRADTRRLIDNRTWELRRFSQRLECPNCDRQFLPVEPKLFNFLSIGGCAVCRGTGQNSDHVACPACQGTRYREEALCVRIANQNIAEVCSQDFRAVRDFVRNLQRILTKVQLAQSERIRRDLERRLSAVCDLGLDYLNLNRSSDTLSCGEIRRLSLAAVIGRKITGTLVVIDEPSAGLSVAEMPRVVHALRKIQSERNSIIVVEHAPSIVASADYVIELGPGAGPAGGSVLYQGPPRIDERTTVSVDAPHPAPTRSKHSHATGPTLQLNWIRSRRLPIAEVNFPLGQLCVVTGPSGSGKTTLVAQILYPAVCRKLGQPCPIKHPVDCQMDGGEQLTEVVLIDQSPLARSSRSNPATWLDVFDEIRETFANTADARHRGFTALHFSFNSVSGGRCRSCLGTGLLRHDLQFLPDITLICPECQGARYRPEILEVKYRGRSIADVLAMTVAEAAGFFRSQPRLQNRFQILKQIRLDYLVLGQPSETLSGGEAQRLKLAARIIKPVNGRGLIISDEPTTGLHPADVRHLIACFRELLANGQTVIVADNSPELLEVADFTLELIRR